MRLLLVDSVPFTYGGGYEQFLLSFARTAAHGGHDVLLVAPPRDTSARLARVLGLTVRDALSEDEVTRRAHPARVSAVRLREGRKLAVEADIVYVKNEPHELAMAWSVGSGGSKLVVGMHSATEGRPGLNGRLRARAYRSNAYRRLASRAAAFHALQPHQATFLVRRLRIPPDVIWHIPNGVDLQRFVPHSHEPDGTFRILFAGRLDRQKGTDVFLESLSGIAVTGCAVSVTVAGEGPMRNLVESAAARFPSVTFAGYEPNPARLYASHDLLVAPSRWEVFPLVPCEALACGLPVVLSDIPANEIFRGTDATVVCRVGDPAGVAAAVRQRIDMRFRSPAAYLGLRDSARRFAELKFDERRSFASLLSRMEGIA